MCGNVPRNIGLFILPPEFSGGFLNQGGNMSDISTNKINIKSQSGKHIRCITATGLLSALAFVLQFFEFSVPVMPPFIKMDLSDMPELIGAFAYGPFYGVIIALLKNIIHMPFSQDGGVGGLCNFLLGACFALPAGIIYRYKKTRTGALIGALTGAVLMAIASFPINYFIIYPFYEHFMKKEAIVAAYRVILPGVKNLAQCLLIFNVPFTFFKGLTCVAITFLVYKRLSPLLHGES